LEPKKSPPPLPEKKVIEKPEEKNPKSPILEKKLENPEKPEKKIIEKPEKKNRKT